MPSRQMWQKLGVLAIFPHSPGVCGYYYEGMDARCGDVSGMMS